MQLKNISKKDSLSLDNVCYLIVTTYGKDGFGKRVVTGETETMCFCAELPVTSNEFFVAKQAGVKSEVALLLDSECYNGETVARYNGSKYAIYRTYPRSDGMIELYLSERMGM